MIINITIMSFFSTNNHYTIWGVHYMYMCVYVYTCVEGQGAGNREMGGYYNPDSFKWKCWPACGPPAGYRSISHILGSSTGSPGIGHDHQSHCPSLKVCFPLGTYPSSFCVSVKIFSFILYKVKRFNQLTVWEVEKSKIGMPIFFCLWWGPSGLAML